MIYIIDPSKLGYFSSECRQLGRSYAVILAARELREQLDHILLMFYYNAAQLSPSLKDSVQTDNQHMDGTVDLESFPRGLEKTASTFENFRERLGEFREYTEESVKIKALIGSFVKDLKYRARCLDGYNNQVDSHHIRCYFHDLTAEMGGDIDNILSAFTFFIKYGMPAIRYEQKRDTDNVLNMSTVATFFSAVTATTLQMSVSVGGTTGIVSIVNTFWFCSLVLSIGAALNSVMAVAWKQATYGSRGRRLPLWVTIWIHASAPVFLTASIACFSVGLVLFTYATDQARYTSAVTLAATAITSFGLATVSGWIAYEQWIAPFFHRNALWRQKKKPDSSKEGTHTKSKHVRPSMPAFRRTRTGSISDYSDSSSHTDASFDLIARTTNTILATQRPINALVSGIRSFAGPGGLGPTQAPDPEDLRLPRPATTESVESPRDRWVKNIRAVGAMRSVTKKLRQNSLRTTHLPESPSNPTLTRVPEFPISAPTDGRVSPSSLVFPEKPQRILTIQQGVKLQDLEYSPDGKFLTTTSFDAGTTHSTTVNYIIEANFSYTYRRRHPQHRVSKQVTWSPDGDRLLVRLDHSIEILDTNCRNLRTVKRPHGIESVAWCTATAFLAVEKSKIVKFSLDGQVLAKHRFSNLLLRDVAVVPNSEFLLVVGRVTFSGDEMQPNNSRAEKQFILYDMEKKEYRSCNPLLDDVRHIKLSWHMSPVRNGFDVLIGHKNKAPPQLWTLEPHLRSFHQLKPGSVHLQAFAELTGPGYFAGEQEQMILCADSDGSMHVWDRESGTHICRIPVQAVSNGLRCLAWSPPGADSVTFATASANELKIWSMAQPDRPQPSEGKNRRASDRPHFPGMLHSLSGTGGLLQEEEDSIDPNSGLADDDTNLSIHTK